MTTVIFHDFPGYMETLLQCTIYTMCAVLYICCLRFKYFSPFLYIGVCMYLVSKDSSCCVVVLCLVLLSYSYCKYSVLYNTKISAEHGVCVCL